MLRVLAQRASAEVVHSLPVYEFDIVHRVQDAFRFLANGKNTGKVVLRMSCAHVAPALQLGFGALRSRLDASAGAAAAAIDLDRLADALSLLDRLCRQFVREALKGLDPTTVVKWHHKLLLQWCAGARDGWEGQVDGAAVERAHAGVAPEVALASRCGPHLRAALQGTTAYQELLFPGGSMDAVLPVYQDAVVANFYNGVVLAAVEAVVAGQEDGRQLCVLEVGAGTGGTAAMVLPALQNACAQYLFTDVSEVFLLQAQQRFAEYAGFMRYELLNIDADPRLQGFALAQQHLSLIHI